MSTLCGHGGYDHIKNALTKIYLETASEWLFPCDTTASIPAPVEPQKLLKYLLRRSAIEKGQGINKEINGTAWCNGKIVD